MVTIEGDALQFSFPLEHESAKLRIGFRRTLRIPDDNQEWPLPPGLGSFPLKHVDDHAARLPASWKEHGGVFLPMYQAEALWIDFLAGYPCAVKIAAGKINAVSGKPWRPELDFHDQDYVVVPGQPWLDGFCVAKGKIRQFVAMPLGQGYSVEEQLSGTAEHGGLQIIVYPLRPEFYLRRRFLDKLDLHIDALAEPCLSVSCDVQMGLGAGGLMHQDIYVDERPHEHWNTTRPSRCFVHLLNSAQYRAVTGEPPPTQPPTAKQYTDAGLPWFDYYADKPAISGGASLKNVQSVGALAGQQSRPLENVTPAVPPKVVKVGPDTSSRVREGDF